MKARVRESSAHGDPPEWLGATADCEIHGAGLDAVQGARNRS